MVSGRNFMLGARALCCGLLVLSCASRVPPASTSSEASALQAQRVAPALVRLDGVRLEPGISSASVSVAGATREFWLSVPEGALRERPLIVFLHGARGGPRTKQLLRCLAVPGFAELAPIIVAPLSDKGEWWLDADAGYVLGLVDAALERWPVRADRVVISGYSNGGIGTWAYARLYPERFSAALPMASNATVMGKTPLAIYAIHGEKDELFDAHEVQAEAARLRRTGSDVTLDVRHRGSHMAPCSYVPELERGARWLLEHAWANPRAKSG